MKNTRINPALIRSRTWVLMAIALAWTSTPSQNLTPYNWCQKNIPATVKFNSRLSPVDPDVFREEIKAAMATWTNITECEFELSPGDSPTTPYVPNSYRTRDFVNVWDRIDLPTTKGGETDCFKDPVTGQVWECDSAYNHRFTFSLHPSPGSTDFSIRGVALHELGHWLVLGHTSVGADVMNPANCQKGKHKIELSVNDEAGCRQIYVSGDEPWRSPCPRGACCGAPALGPCKVTDDETCDDHLGVWLAQEQLCGESTCGSYTGACCIGETPVCEVRSYDSCQSASGSYKGNDTDCSTTSCAPPPATGACCVAGGCMEVFQGACGGTWIGGSCTPQTCEGGGSPGGPGPDPGEGCYTMGCEEENPPLDFAVGCTVREAEYALNVAGSSDPENLEYGPPIGCANCSGGLGVAMMRILRERMRLSTVGIRLASVYYHHNAELRTILSNDPALRVLAGNRINDYMPALRTFLYNDPNGADFILDDTRVVQLQDLVDDIKLHASPGLADDLDAFMLDVNAQRGKSMVAVLSSMVGLPAAGSNWAAQD